MNSAPNPALVPRIIRVGSIGLALLFGLFVLSCGQNTPPKTDALPLDSDLPPEAQIGPITQLELGPLDEDMAAAGKESFRLRCSACHQIDKNVVGPALGNVLNARSPVYVMNMIMNPTEMLSRHPVAIALLKEFAVPMADLGVSEKDAREILEYLRTESAMP